MSKKPNGHYCRICGQYKANEKFSGRGHTAHICKACAKRGNKPPEIDIGPLVFMENDSFDILSGYDTDIDNLVFTANAEPQKLKRKRKMNKAKLLRSAQKKQAKALLSEILVNGAVSKEVITEATNSAGIPIEALRRAKASLGIRSEVTDNGSVWVMPQHNKQPFISAVSPEPQKEVNSDDKS